MRFKRVIFLSSILLLTLLACSLGGLFGSDDNGSSSGGIDKPDDALEISIIYAPESRLYLPEAIENFNRSYANGNNPLTGGKLGSDEKPIFVTGEEGSSGTIHQAIVNAVISPNNALVARPTIFAPY